jgi:hypothetical protein
MSTMASRFMLDQDLFFLKALVCVNIALISRIIIM